MPRVFDKVRCVCGREIGTNAIKRHRGLCVGYWKARTQRAEGKLRGEAIERVLPTPARIVTTDEEE